MIDQEHNKLEVIAVDDDDLTFIVVDNIFGVPLYGFYIFIIENFAPDDIQGTLLDPPFETQGPFETQHDAMEIVRSLLNNSPENSQPS